MKEPEAMQEIHAVRRKLQVKWSRMTTRQLKKELERGRKLAEQWGLRTVDRTRLAA